MACNVPLLEAEQMLELKCTRVVMQRREPSKLQASSCFSGRYLEHVAGKPASQISLVDNNRVNTFLRIIANAPRGYFIKYTC